MTRELEPDGDRISVSTRHSLLEDTYALISGAIFLALGLQLLASAKLVTGGVVGIGLTLSYVTGMPFSLFYGCLSLPTLLLADRAMGRAFMIKTVLAILLVVMMSAAAPHLLSIAHVDRGAAAIVGGSLTGIGALALARHNAATGGSGVIILWLYKAKGWNSGSTQMVIDGLVLAASLPVIGFENTMWSLVGLAGMAGMMFAWHRPGRYMGY